MSNRDATEELLQRWLAGDEQAAEEIYDRYAPRLLELAKGKIDQRLQRRLGEEDIVQSVFRTFFRRVRDGQMRVDHSGTLWHLLVGITMNKARQKARFHRAQKRDFRGEIHGDVSQLAIELTSCLYDADSVDSLLQELSGLLDDLQDRDREIVRLCLLGYSTSDIGQRVHRSRWTVRRVLDRVGNRLTGDLNENSDQ